MSVYALGGEIAVVFPASRRVASTEAHTVLQSVRLSSATNGDRWVQPCLKMATRLLHRSHVREGFSHECESDEVPLQEARVLLYAAGQLLLPRAAERCSVVRAPRGSAGAAVTAAPESSARPSASRPEPCRGPPPRRHPRQRHAIRAYRSGTLLASKEPFRWMTF